MSDAGFIREGSIHEIDSEEKVFAFVGMPQPPKRVEVEI